MGRVCEMNKINRIIEKAAEPVLKIETLSARRWKKKKKEMLRQTYWLKYNYAARLYFEDHVLHFVSYEDYIACNLL